MGEFWASRTGGQITGSDKDSFLPDFTIIPNGTTAKAQIKKFELVEQVNKFTQSEEVFYEITWKIIDGDFKSREVSQKIKPFVEKAESIDRALNMLKRVFDLCNYKPTHANAPTSQELMAMHNKILGIKIREWSQPKRDGSGFMEGNFVSEVHAITDQFKVEVGEKLATPVINSSSPESALNRNPRIPVDLDSDIPF
jgi:hypothetical protein